MYVDLDIVFIKKKVKNYDIVGFIIYLIFFE